MLSANGDDGEGTHLIVVEPHADDAYLSLHDHLVRWKKRGFTITILTVQSAVKNRAAEARTYADTLGVKWLGLGFDYGELPEKIDFSLVPGDYSETRRIISPLGLQHPDHIHIRRILRPDLVYFDIPYAFKQKNQDTLNAALTNRLFDSFYVPHHSKREKKYWGVFKSQSGFFFYNDPVTLSKMPEITLVPEST
jgi:hypothetical protein